MQRIHVHVSAISHYFGGKRGPWLDFFRISKMDRRSGNFFILNSTKLEIDHAHNVKMPFIRMINSTSYEY